MDCGLRAAISLPSRARHLLRFEKQAAALSHREPQEMTDQGEGSNNMRTRQRVATLQFYRRFTEKFAAGSR